MISAEMCTGRSSVFPAMNTIKFSTASLITRSTNDVQQVQMTMAMMFRIVLYAPILGLGGVLRVLQTNSSMTWILGVGVVLILVLIGMLFTIAMPKIHKAADIDRQVKPGYKRNSYGNPCHPGIQQRKA